MESREIDPYLKSVGLVMEHPIWKRMEVVINNYRSLLFRVFVFLPLNVPMTWALDQGKTLLDHEQRKDNK